MNSLEDAEKRPSTQVSIVILTYNRPGILRELLVHLKSSLTCGLFEIIVVDNSTDDRTQLMIETEFLEISYLKSEENLGTEGRNVGMKASCGDYIITLDDDIIGIDDANVATILEIFEQRKQIGAVCFKVVDAETRETTNWIHHYPMERFENKSFVTDEMTEGAVAFRRVALEKSGLYPSYFFISHEGPDLAIRIMNNNYDVIYDPRIVVTHCHAKEGRKTWRRYYFDTRNMFWLAARNYPWFSGVIYVSRGLLAMFVYSVRDGFLRYWFKGIFDGVRGIRRALSDRVVMAPRTRAIICAIKKQRPNLLYMARKRLFRREVRI